MRPDEHLAAVLAAETAGQPIDFVFFWGHQPRPDGTIGPGCLSQWWHAPFTENGVTYPTAEHWMMAGKARLFGDEKGLAAVLAGNLAKFGQNPDLGAFLSATGRQVLVEASPRDRVWGIGMGASHPDATRPSRWRGTNPLGFALMNVRDQL